MSRIAFITAPATACALFALSGVAFGHAKLDPGEARAGSTYTGVVRIGHGCEGTPTLKVRLSIPDGVVATDPPGKDGWTVEVVRAVAGAHAHHSHVAAPIREIVWTGRLPDKDKGDFPFAVSLPDGLAGQHALAFPVVQECETGSHHWVEIPAHGQSHKDVKSPAPLLKLVPANAPAAVASAPARLHVHIHGEKAMADVVLTPGRHGRSALMVVPMTMEFAALDARAVSVSFAQSGAPTVETAVARTPEGPWAAPDIALPRGGRWTVTLSIILATGETVVLRDTLDVPAPAS